MIYLSMCPSSRTLRHCVFGLLFALPLIAAAQAEPCSIVRLSDVEAALPASRPWKLTSGGAGSCRFEARVLGADGRSIYTVMFRLLQQYHAAPKAAAETLQTVRTEFAKRYVLSDVEIQGAAPGAFRFEDGNALGWYAQVGKGIVSGSYLSMQGPPDAAEVAGLTALAQKAAAATSQPAAAAAAGVCPHFDEAIVRKLLGGKDVKIEQFGSNSCVATNARQEAVMFTGIQAESLAAAKQIFKSMQSADCTNQPLTDVGPQGLLMFNCRSAPTHAAASFFKGVNRYEYTLALQGREPTEQDLAQLVEQARWRFLR